MKPEPGSSPTCSWHLRSLQSRKKKSNDASKVILALESKWNDAYQRGNIDALNLLLAGDFIITVEDDTTYSKSGYASRLGGPAQHIEFSKIAD